MVTQKDLDMKLTTILTGYFKLDGGAMFGIVPKTIWSRLNPPDEKNLCTWALRCLLIETGNRKILVDAGIGDKQDAKWRSFFEPHGEETLKGGLAAAGLSPNDITDVLLTHLHFDHCGGAVEMDETGNLVPTFKNAVYWSNRLHFDWAVTPNERERASFLKENFLPLEKGGHLQFLTPPKGENDLDWLPGIRLRFVYGHTEAMMLPILSTSKGTLAYCADLMPSSHHLGMPYVMAYDVRPLEVLKEKQKLLSEAVENQWFLMFEHDPKIECGSVTADEFGRFRFGGSFRLAERF